MLPFEITNFTVLQVQSVRCCFCPENIRINWTCQSVKAVILYDNIVILTLNKPIYTLIQYFLGFSSKLVCLSNQNKTVLSNFGDAKLFSMYINNPSR